jgi:cell wall-associated NlpC family hydrolase
MKNRIEEMIEYGKRFIGCPYRWGGNGPQFDCSGFVQECLMGVGLDPRGDQTAQALYDELLTSGWKIFQARGSIMFFGKNTHKITHVAIALDENDFMLECGGGGRYTASEMNGAMVRIRPVRSDHIVSLQHPTLVQLLANAKSFYPPAFDK